MEVQQVVIDIARCEDEPIHIPGAVQPHGAMLVLAKPTLRIEQASESVLQHLGEPAERLLGEHAGALFQPLSGEALVRAAHDHRAGETLNLTASNGRSFDARLHEPESAGGLLIVELEPSQTEPSGLHPGLRASIARLAKARELSALYDAAAEEVRALTGFDRVMVYRFDAEGHGEVVSEHKRSDLEPFLGLHYPAADIPAQARRLYEQNWLRLIADVSARPSPLVPRLHPRRREPLDMSHAALRSVSPVHIQYLRNMGVTAAMSISLIDQQQLRGLIACHHYSGPHHVSQRVRDGVELLGQLLSWHVSTREAAQLQACEVETRRIEAHLLHYLSQSTSLAEGLLHPALLELVAADGAAIVYDGTVAAIGETPPANKVLALTTWLRQHVSSDVFATDRVGSTCPVELGEGTAGALAMTISRELGDYIVWFRKPLVHTVRWAGIPEKVLVPGRAGSPPRLSPRGSFAQWCETVRGRAQPWEPYRVSAASDLRGGLLDYVRRRARELRELTERLAAADRAKDNFIATVSHELRRPLHTITGWTHMLQAGAVPAERVRHAIDVIARNVEAQAHLVDDLIALSELLTSTLALQAEHMDISPLVQRVADSFHLSAQAKRLDLRLDLEPECWVRADPARVAQVLQKLLSNAIKFTPRQGSVSVLLRHSASEVELCVTDTGQGIAPEFLPHVFEPFRQEDESVARLQPGLGLGLSIVKQLIELHGGRVAVSSSGVGSGTAVRVLLPRSPGPSDAQA